ncbi:MAG TPA: O-antigen ligase family protein [Prolixibacteraceae bacterium]|nr:O-antigen ligase family protein [Prolixibacteraceae bacterium]
MLQARGKIALFYLISALFILLNAYFLVKRESMILNALPVVLAILMLTIYAFDKLLYLVVIFTPLSLPLSEIMPGLSFDMFLPTEPLLFGILLIFIMKYCAEGKFDREIMRHPVTIAIYFSLFWILLTSLTSTMPVVSLKFFLARIWFIVGFYLLTAKLFESTRNMEKYVWLYTLPLVIVIFYTVTRLYGHGLWNKHAAHFVASPFYNDHTSYGAVIAMYLPFLFGFSFTRIYTPKTKIFVRIILVILIAGLILSYTRAAWVSMLAALGVWVIMRLRIRFIPLFTTSVVLLALVFAFQTQLLMYLERNDTESSANLGEHLSSISNISSDASNLERINRWNSAIRMFEDKPVFGFGPGTYMFNYAPYQLNANRTIISTNSADRGNAHSEYLGPLAESGFMGLISFLIIIIITSYTAIRAYSRTNDKRLKTLLMGALLGLITYYIHGIMNNFLDTDKLSVPFWGFTAIIVAIDIHTRKAKAEALPENMA